MVINTNTTSAFAARILAGSTSGLSKSLAKLSSGSKIVSPEDDAAGLAVSSKFQAQIGRIGAARSNVGNAISFSQTQDGFLGTIDKSLRRMSELATLSTDQTKSSDDVDQYQKEFDELRSFIEDTAGKTFNGQGLFATTLADLTITAGTADILTRVGDPAGLNATSVQKELNDFNTSSVAANATLLGTSLLLLSTEVRQEEADDGALAALGSEALAHTYWEAKLGASYDVSAPTSTAGVANYKAIAEAVIARVKADYGGMSVTDASDATSYQVKGIDVSVLEADVKSTGTMASLSKSTAASYVSKLSVHINTLAGNRAYVGANISRLNMVEGQLAVYGENLGAANSRIVDVDVATESSNYARQQILVQSGTAMLAQANMLPQSALMLLQ